MINRREMITGLVAASAVPSTAQAVSPVGTIPGPGFQNPPMPSKEELEKEYATCKLRGHTPTSWGNIPSPDNPFAAVLSHAVFIAVQNSPVYRYQAQTSTGWETCWYCKKRYRYVTNIEEIDHA